MNKNEKEDFIGKIFLVIETGDEEQLREEATYRNIHLRGRTYNEEEFRKWVNQVWNVSKDLAISELTQACKKGGWSVFELTKIQAGILTKERASYGQEI